MPNRLQFTPLGLKLVWWYVNDIWLKIGFLQFAESTNSKNLMWVFFFTCWLLQKPCFLFKVRVGFPLVASWFYAASNDPQTDKPKPFGSPRNRCTWASCTKDSNLGHFRLQPITKWTVVFVQNCGTTAACQGKNVNGTSVLHVSVFPPFFGWNVQKYQNIPNTRMPFLLTLLDAHLLPHDEFSQPSQGLISVEDFSKTWILFTRSVEATTRGAS